MSAAAPTLELADGLGEAFWFQTETGRGAVSHCAESACLETIIGDGKPELFLRPEHDPANVNWKQLDLLICLFAETTSRKDRSSLFHQQLVNQPLTALFWDGVDSFEKGEALEG